MTGWDETVNALHASRPARRTERVLWTLHKDTRVAEARVWPHPHGQELRFLVNGELLWSEVFAPGRGTALGELAEAKRTEFEARGWRVSTDGPLVRSG